MTGPFVVARGEAPKQARPVEILRFAQDDIPEGFAPGLEKLEAALLVLDTQHVGAEDFIEDGLAYRRCRDPLVQARGYALSRLSKRAKQTRYPGVEQDGNQQDDASQNVIPGGYLANPLKAPT